MNHFMKINRFFTLSLVFGLAFFAFQKAFGDIEIDLGDSKSAPAPSKLASPTPAPISMSNTSQTVPPSTKTPMIGAAMRGENTPTNQGTPNSIYSSPAGNGQPSITPTPVVQVIQGVLKAKDIYEAGIKAYKEKDYDTAIRYLKNAVIKSDPYTPKYIYAEAYATLGVIYQFYFPVEGHLQTAREYYKHALRYESTNPTALKYLKKLKTETQ